MVIYEDIGNNLTKAYSSEGKMIRGGFPEGMYAEAYDPTNAHREYVETDEYIPTQPSIQKGRIFSRLYLEMAIAKLGLIGQFDNLLKNIEIEPGYTAYRAFERANEISEDFPHFNEYLQAIKTSLNLTDQQVESVLSSAVASTN